MSKGRFVAKPPFTVVVFDQWDHDCPGWELAVRENLKEAIAIAKEFNDKEIEKAGDIGTWVLGSAAAFVYASNNDLAFNGREDAKKRHNFTGFNFSKKEEEGK